MIRTPFLGECVVVFYNSSYISFISYLAHETIRHVAALLDCQCHPCLSVSHVVCSRRGSTATTLLEWSGLNLTRSESEQSDSNCGGAKGDSDDMALKRSSPD